MSYNVFDAIKDTIFNNNDCWASEEVAKERARICDGCQFKSRLNICNECGCFLPAKVKYRLSTCPRNKWNS